MKKLILSISCFVSFQAFAQQSIQGYVFADSNKNGKKDRSEKGVPNVAVSNGSDVVITDKNGKYELNLSDDNQIFVIKPSNYAIALDQYNLPKYYVTHKPKGSPANLKYEGVSPTEKLPKELNFALIPSQESEDFNSFIFGDPQTYTMEEVNYFRKAIVDEAKTKNKGKVFGISLGDLVGDDLSLHTPYKEVMKDMGLPWYNVIGNHDMNLDAKDDLYSDETFERNFGPANYAFNYGNTHFVVLDNILYPDPRDGKGYWGGFRQDQIDFLKNELQFVDKNKLVVISFHIPLFVGDESHFEPKSRQAFMDIIKDFPNLLILSAHMHTQSNQFYGEKHGWKGSKPLHEYNVGTTSGDWYSGELNEDGVPVSTMRDGTPRGYAFLKIKGNQYQLDYKVAGKPEEYKVEIYAPNVIADKGWNSSMIVANVFMGTEKDKVEYRIDNASWKQMKKIEAHDPTYNAMVQKWDLSKELLTGRRPSNPEISNHLWQTKAPNNLGVGNHTIEVKVTDMFGRTYTSKRDYKIEPKK